MRHIVFSTLILAVTGGPTALAASEIESLIVKPEKVGMSSERLARLGKRMQEHQVKVCPGILTSCFSR
jgi:hypothetical protein